MEADMISKLRNCNSELVAQTMSKYYADVEKSYMTVHAKDFNRIDFDTVKKVPVAKVQPVTAVGYGIVHVIVKTLYNRG